MNMCPVLLFCSLAVATCQAFLNPQGLIRHHPRESRVGFASLLPSLWLASDNMEESKNNQDLIDFQKSQGSGGDDLEFLDETSFLKNQQRIFDDMSDWFASEEAIPDDVKPIMQHIGRSIVKDALAARQKNDPEETTGNETSQDDGVSGKLRILDVACGAGPLFDVLIEAANDLNVELDLVGIDLSSKMAALADKHAKKLVEKHKQHSITVQATSVIDFTTDKAFDAITANACFGNFWDPKAILLHFSTLLNVGGSLFVTHPLGADFVASLHEQDPNSVPHTLPSSISSWDTLTRLAPLEGVEFRESYESRDGETFRLYYSRLERYRRRLLPEIVRLRGSVDSGYGRGGKKLGFPTANLPSSDFESALSNVTTGVYFGWALVEGLDEDIKQPIKAVVNVGYSPTFEGKENAEKIVEAHLIAKSDEETLGDFYGSTMRLQLHGFLRPEIKFPSFPDLIAQIRADVSDANEALDEGDFFTLASDRFFRQAFDGKEPSWEFESSEEFLFSA